MGKVDINKKQKKNALLQTAFDLFRDKGFAKTTISDIVSDAWPLQRELSIYILRINMI